MKKKYYLIIPSLLFSLFIYIFYRTEKTVINKLLTYIIPFDYFIELQKNIVDTLPLNEFIIYSLPEGLWVFSISLLSKYFFIKINKYKMDLIFIPLIFSVGLEFFQLFHITNGLFDYWDIGISVFFWLIANYTIQEKTNNLNILTAFNLDSLFCSLSYLIVYLAHVWK